MSSDGDYLVVTDHWKHTSAEGIDHGVERIQIRGETREYIGPTRFVWGMVALMVGIWGSMHILSFLNFGSYMHYVFTLGLNTQSPTPYEYVTSVFVHGNIAHLAVNMIAFLSFGGVLSRKLNSNYKFFLYFIGAGSIPAFIQLIAFNISGLSQNIPIVGASGAICALFAYFAFSKPNHPVLLFFVLRMKAKNAFAGFFLFSLFAVSLWGIGAGGVAHIAHITGLCIGVLTAVRFEELPEKAPLVDANYLYPVKSVYSSVANISGV